MGLDMYLERGKKIPKKSFDEVRCLNDLVCSFDNEVIKKEYKDYLFERGEHFKWTSFFKEVVYWRKANAIHKWFVDNVQDGEDDCGYYEVKKEDIEELLEICKKVISGECEAREVLPTQDGFFFGSTDYDEYYEEDVEYTIKKLEEVLENTDFDNEYLVYTSSW